MIEIAVSLGVTGVILIISAFGRLRHIKSFLSINRYLKETFDVDGLDLTGNTAYTDCFSHEWVVDKFSKVQHNRFGLWFQQQFLYSTLFTSLWFGIVVGVSAMLFGILVISSFLTLGTGIFIFFFGALIAMGPGGPKYSEELLLDLNKISKLDLSREDYPFVKIALTSISQWTLFSCIIGAIFLISAPYGTLLFDVSGAFLVHFGELVLWGPMYQLFDIFLPLGIIYISLIIPFIFIIIPLFIYIIYKRIRFSSLFDMNQLPSRKRTQ
ncbi:MAG: hypothetical protein ACFFF4_17335 [Candidatus Thorarchaeota archaeon]